MRPPASAVPAKPARSVVDVQEGAAYVDALRLPVRQHCRGAQVGGGSDQGHDQHDPAAHLGRGDQPANRGVADPGSDQEQRDSVHLGREHLDSPQPVGPAPGGRPGGDTDGSDRESERKRVGEHVTGVGQERERVRDDPESDLYCHHSREERQRQEKRAPVVAAPIGTRCEGTMLVLATHARVPGRRHTRSLRAYLDRRAQLSWSRRGCQGPHET